MDLGWLVNAGFSDKFGLSADEDNQFSVKVQIQMSDAAYWTQSGFVSKVYLSVKVGDVIVVGMKI